MNKKLNTILKLFKLGAYASVSFDIKFGDNLRNYTVENTTKYDESKKPTSVKSYSVTISDIKDSTTTVVNTITGVVDSLPKMLKFIYPFEGKDVIAIIVTTWGENNKLVYIKGYEIILQREHSWYQAIYVNTELVTFSKFLQGSVDYTPTTNVSVISYFQTVEVITVTNGERVYVFVKETKLNCLKSEFIDSMEDMI